MAENWDASSSEVLESAARYSCLLAEAREIAERSLGRLRTLREQFPSSFDQEFIAQVERIRNDPVHERRRFARLQEVDVPATVSEGSDFASWQIARLIDYSVGGVALHLERPLQPGSIFLIWLGSICREQAWIPLQVKHCEREGTHWIVGGEFAGRIIPPFPEENTNPKR